MQSTKKNLEMLDDLFEYLFMKGQILNNKTTVPEFKLYMDLKGEFNIKMYNCIDNQTVIIFSREHDYRLYTLIMRKANHKIAYMQLITTIVEKINLVDSFQWNYYEMTKMFRRKRMEGYCLKRKKYSSRYSISLSCWL